MYKIQAGKWDVDRGLQITKGSRHHFIEFRGNTIKEAMFNYKDARDNNEVTKYSGLTIYDVINTEE